MRTNEAIIQIIRDYGFYAHEVDNVIYIDSKGNYGAMNYEWINPTLIEVANRRNMEWRWITTTKIGLFKKNK